MDEYLKQLDEDIARHHEIKANSNEAFFKIRFQKRLVSVFTIARKNTTISSVSSTLIFISNLLGNIVLFVLVAISIFKGIGTVGQFVTIIAYVNQMKNLISTFSSTTSSIIPSVIAIERVKSTMDKGNRYMTYKSKDGDSIVIDNISLSYPNQIVFDSFSYIIDSAGLFLIKGKNGTGKTTLLNLISGIYSSNANITGRIAINSNSIFYLNSESILYTMSVRANIAFGQNISDKRILEIIKSVNLDYKIKTRLDLDYIVNKEIAFSSGEMKRLLLARLLSSNADIIILDEIELALDDDSREILIEILNNLSKCKTILLATHSVFFDAYSKEIIEL